MTQEWFVVNLHNPRVSALVTADNVLEAVVQYLSDYNVHVESWQLEARATMRPAGFAVWRADALSEAPMLVRERCA